MIVTLLLLVNISLAGEQPDWHAYNRMGLAADAEGRYEDALQHFVLAVEAARSLTAAERARSAHNLAATHQRLGHGGEAVRFYREALELWRKAENADPAEPGRVWRNLTVLLRTMARFPEALEAGRQAVRGLSAAGGASAAAAYFELAEVQRAMGDHAAALASARQGAGQEGNNDRVLRSRLLELEAMLLHESGDSGRAMDMQRTVLKAYESQLPPGHRYLVSAMNNLGQMLLAAGDSKAAEPLIAQARQAALGWSRPSLLQAAVSNNLAQAYRMQKRLAEAEPLYREARAVASRVLGPSHPDVAKITKNLGDLFALQGKMRGAEQLYAEALGAAESALGLRHRQTIEAATALGQLYRGAGRDAEYVRLMRRFAE
jgi:tetratricopeptide (TPR) repeat protein